MDTAIVVEPQKSRQKLITGVLEEQGIQVRVYDKPEEAVRRVEEDVPDFIIMDVKMPGQSGRELLEKLRTLDVKLILLTDSKLTSRQLSTYGAMNFLVAPFNRNRLAARINEIRAKRSTRSKVINVPALDSHALTLHMLADLHEPITGRLDAGRIAEYLGIPLSALSRCLERSVAGVHKGRSAPTIQHLLTPIARSVAILARLLGSRENVRIWVNSPHPDLEGRTPLSVILEGKAAVVTEMLEAALAGQPA